MSARTTQGLARDVLDRVGGDADALRRLVDLLDRRLLSGPLERTMRLWGVSQADLGRMFGVSRQAIGQWVDDGPPSSRADEIAKLGKMTDLLDRWIKRDRIPAVVRRSVPALGGRSRLDVARAGELDLLLDELRETFDLDRVAP
jgi:hypothetical protein